MLTGLFWWWAIFRLHPPRTDTRKIFLAGHPRRDRKVRNPGRNHFRPARRSKQRQTLDRNTALALDRLTGGIPPNSPGNPADQEPHSQTEKMFKMAIREKRTPRWTDFSWHFSDPWPAPIFTFPSSIKCEKSDLPGDTSNGPIGSPWPELFRPENHTPNAKMSVKRCHTKLPPHTTLRCCCCWLLRRVFFSRLKAWPVRLATPPLRRFPLRTTRVVVVVVAQIRTERFLHEKFRTAAAKAFC